MSHGAQSGLPARREDHRPPWLFWIRVLRRGEVAAKLRQAEVRERGARPDRLREARAGAVRTARQREEDPPHHHRPCAGRPGVRRLVAWPVDLGTADARAGAAGRVGGGAADSAARAEAHGGAAEEASPQATNQEEERVTDRGSDACLQRDRWGHFTMDEPAGPADRHFVKFPAL